MHRADWTCVFGRVVREMDVCVQTHERDAQQASIETPKTPIGRFLQQFRVMLRAFRHPDVPWYAKLAAGCVVGYVLSPIQLIPNFIPVIGQLDDVLVVSLGIRLLRRWVPPRVLRDCQTCNKQKS